jgi:hypothetical protein
MLGAMTMNEPPASSVCVSCGAPRAGKWCSACGEKFLEHSDMDLPHFLFKVLPHELFEFDGKLLRSVRMLMTKPGALAADYVAGRRRPFISPLRLCLVVFVVYAFIGIGISSHEQSFNERLRLIDPSGFLVHWAEARPEVHWDSPEVRERLRTRGHWLSECGTLLIFLLIAVLQKLIFFRQHRRYLEHAALALSVGAFYIGVVALLRILGGIFIRDSVPDLEANLQTIISVTALPAYWWLAIRRFYGTSIIATSVSALTVTVGHVLCATAINIGIFALLIATA